MISESKQGLPCIQVDETACHECRYFGKPYCSSVAMRDAFVHIRWLEKRVKKLTALLEVMGITIPEEKYDE